MGGGGSLTFQPHTEFGEECLGSLDHPPFVPIRYPALGGGRFGQTH